MTRYDPVLLAAHCGLDPQEVICLPTLDSTNSHAKRLAREGRKQVLVLAETQTAGRGRMGHSFFSPAGSGLYFSLLLRRSFGAREITFLTIAAAVYAAQELERLTGQAIELKWVNDLYRQQRKIGGILCESGYRGDGTPAFTVVGIGLNWVTPADGFPSDIVARAGALCSAVPPIERQYAFIGQLVRRLLAYRGEPDRPPLLTAYRQRLFMLSRPVSFECNGQLIRGIAEAIDEQACLLVRDESGTLHRLEAGEVHITLH